MREACTSYSNEENVKKKRESLNDFHVKQIDVLWPTSAAMAAWLSLSITAGSLDISDRHVSSMCTQELF